MWVGWWRIKSLYKLTSARDTSWKHRTRSSCPTKSIVAEWIGSAYMSGSRSFDHKKSVRAFAISSDIVTAQQNKSTERTANSTESLSHPKACKVARNIISTGIVMRIRVVVTSFLDGSLLRDCA